MSSFPFSVKTAYAKFNREDEQRAAVLQPWSSSRRVSLPKNPILVFSKKFMYDCQRLKN